MRKFDITGMSCAACSARVEKAVSELKGIEECSVNLLTNSMTVKGEAATEEIINAVVKAGYGASEATANSQKTKDLKTPKLKKRLIASIILLLPLMYLSMGHVMWGFYLPQALENSPFLIGLLQMALALAIMVINKKFFINGFKGLINRSPNMDTLVSLGSLVAFLYSIYILFNIYSVMRFNDILVAKHYLHQLYFESSGMILTLITVGKMLEARAKGKTTTALEGLMKLAPKTATVIIDGEEKTILIENVKKGDVFVVRPGEQIPVDGVVLEGESTANESALTGESMPVLKKKDSPVFAGTINTNGFIKCVATKVGEDTDLSIIIKMVSQASSTKAPIAKIADKVSGVFVPIILGIAIITFAAWFINNGDLGYAVARAISVLVISCPCALGLATPVAIMVGTGVGAKNGVLFKNATSLEQTGKIDIVCLDKTGTITNGMPKVTDILPSENLNEKELLQIAASLEEKSEHPLSLAIKEKAKEENIALIKAEKFNAVFGSGVVGEIEGKKHFGGNAEFVLENCKISNEFILKATELANSGKTPLFFADTQRFLGIIAVADTIKQDSIIAIKELKALGLEVYMLTGDNKDTADFIAKQVGIVKVKSNLKPNEKENIVTELKQKGKVLMVGDGINDAVALTNADIGIALSKGTDIAMDASDIVLVKNSLIGVATAIKLSRKVIKNIKENLFWAFIYNLIGIPLAAGVFGLSLSPMFGAAAMSLSSVTVVSNALRLNLFKANKKEKKKMKTIYIKGMMCPHCEARVKSLLEGTSGVVSAKVSHKKGTAVIEVSEEISNEALKTLIEENGYTVTDIK